MDEKKTNDSSFEGLSEEIHQLLQQAAALRKASSLPASTPFEDIRSGREGSAADEAEEHLPADCADMPLILTFDDEAEDVFSTPVAEEPVVEEEEEELPPPPTQRRNPFKVFWQGFCSNLPRRGDRGAALVRKIAFLLALAVLLGSASYIVYDVAVLPAANANMYKDVAKIYYPMNSQPVQQPEYPKGMLEAFINLYNANDEVRGWLTYSATGKKDFLHINYPVMYSGDNDKYLNHDFYEKKNKNGALFFDMSNNVIAKSQDKVRIIYGHNMASGQMFAGLNKFVGNVNNARAAAVMSLSTLFESAQHYKVFAIVMTDENATGSDYFATVRTAFPTDEDFLTYMEQVRARSLFDYPVEVTADDHVLMLSTCTNTSTAKFKNGRLVVYARRLRDGEDTQVDTAEIVKNEDVIMPRAWYEKQHLPLHPYYGGSFDGYVTTATDTGDATTSADLIDGSTTPSDGSTDTTADGTTTATAGTANKTTGAATTTPAQTTGGQTTPTETAGGNTATATQASQSSDTTTATQASQSSDTTTATQASQSSDTTTATQGGDTTTENAEDTTTAAEGGDSTTTEGNTGDDTTITTEAGGGNTPEEGEEPTQTPGE